MKKLILSILTGIIGVTIGVFMARSSFGFTASTFEQATSNGMTGVIALMNMMQDWLSILYVGIPVGIVVYLIDRYFINGNKKQNNGI